MRKNIQSKRWFVDISIEPMICWQFTELMIYRHFIRNFYISKFLLGTMICGYFNGAHYLLQIPYDDLLIFFDVNSIIYRNFTRPMICSQFIQTDNLPKFLKLSIIFFVDTSLHPMIFSKLHSNPHSFDKKSLQLMICWHFFQTNHFSINYSNYGYSIHILIRIICWNIWFVDKSLKPIICRNFTQNQWFFQNFNGTDDFSRIHSNR